MSDSGASSVSSPLAIVGLSCLFPKAASAGEFWSNIRRGVDAIDEIPSTHWRPEAYFDADPKRPDMTYAQRGGFLSPVPFDPLEFGIAPSNLEAIDTSQLLGLVASKRALEDAGYGADGKPCDRSRIGCILGVTGALEMVIPLGARLGHPKWRQALKDAGVPDDVAADVIERIGESYVPWQENSFPGLLGNVVAGRIANRLDLGGTNCVVDAACASSLSALHLAALELWSGRADMVLTGGVDTFNDIFMYMCFSKTPALSATGDARPFADNADGTILGEGIGVVAVKRLADAERDGDRIYALLRGIGTSSDGAGNAVYAPKKEGQIRCLQDAYKTAGVTPDTIELVEAHGTGTKVGDATEVAALNEVYRASGRTGKWCALGSVKSQIGHTKAAAGSAGLLKAVLALQHRVLPPTIKVERPQDVLDDETSPFYVNTSPRPWMPSEQHPRRAAVSAFGFGGSNFHCVLEESPTAVPEADWDNDVLLLSFSGESLADVKRQLSAWQTPVDANQLRTRAAATRAAFQSRHEHRLVMVCDREKADIAGMVTTTVSLLDKYAEKSSWSTPDGVFYNRGACDGRLAVLFPGQGSQSVGMLRELACRFPVMQDVLAEANRAYVEAGATTNDAARLSDLIYPHPVFDAKDREQQDTALRATQVAQPALGAVSLGALAVLEQFGVKPEVTAGHSYGELTALCASKRIRPEALYRLSMLRGRLMAEAQELDGGMLAVGASLSQVEAIIKEAAVDLVVANRNGPNQVVLSGRLPDIDRAAELFARKNIRGKKLLVAAAFHSPLVATASARFRPELEEVDFASAEVPVFANSSAEEYPEDAGAARDLLAGQLAQPVEFVRQIENMYAAGARTFVEVGPGNVLSGLVGSILSGRDYRAVAIDASMGKRAGLWDLAVAVAQVAVAGHPVKLTGWDPTPPKAPVVDPQRLRVPLSGANYIKPRAPKPPRPPMKTAVVAPIAAAPAATSQSKVLAPAPVAAPRPVASFVTPPPMIAPSAPVSSPLMTSAPVNASALGVLQKMHEETARLHRQFLEGQESALRTLEALARGNSITAAPVARLVAPTPIAAPVAAPAPAPMVTPRIEPQPQAVAPAPVAKGPVTPPVSAPISAAPTGHALTPIVMAVVSSKTGYPVEMLQPKMSLDHDLGIDSIKRVEILSGLQEQLPQLPAVTPEQLQTLHRLSDVIALLEASAPTVATQAKVVTPVTQIAQTSAGALTPIVLSVVSAKTGYPVEMLQPKMSLDHDLGIDSIKRVEILSALQEQLPQLPAVTPEQLQTLHRLSDVIALLEATSPTVPALRSDAPAPVVQSNGSLTPIVLSVVAAKTGYPVEMLQPKMSLDHDLGIDSIKRVEILSALQEQLPQLPAVTPEQLQTLHRLSDVIALLEGSSLPVSTVTTVPAVVSRSEVVAEAVIDPVIAAPQVEVSSDPTAQLVRGEVLAVTLADEPREPLALPAGGEFWITDDGTELSLELAKLLTAAGFKPRIVHFDEPTAHAQNGSLAGLVILSPAGGMSDQRLWNALEWLQKSGTALHQTTRRGQVAVLATVSRLDGACGFGAGLLVDPASGGLAGLSKTVRHEWPEITCKAIDLGGEWSPTDAAAALCQELLNQGPLECGLTPNVRTTVDVIAAPVPTVSATPLSAGDLVLVTGGARGVTAAAALALAKAVKPRMVLLGRSAPPTVEPDWLSPLSTEIEIKQGLAKSAGVTSPRSMQQQCQQILAQREISQTLQELKQAGADAEYHSVDVRDITAVCRLVEQLQRDYGPVRGLIHGAGVLADQKIEDKTREQFDRVFDTKVVGLRNLLGAVPAEALRVLALFSSFTGRYGRTGQIDYAIANEVLNKLAQQFHRREPGCRVVSFNWGPWDGGMVQGGLKALFAKEGVGLIPLDAGAELFARDVRQPATSLVEVVVLGPGSKPLSSGSAHVPAVKPSAESAPGLPSDARLSWEREISVAKFPILNDHVLGGKAVLPVALVTEMLAHGVMHRHPGLEFIGLDRLKIFKGIRLDRDEVVKLQVMIGRTTRAGGRFLIPAQLVSPRGDHPLIHAVADIWLGNVLPEADAPLLQIAGAPCALDKYYPQLFHGPALQGLERIDSLSEEGIAVWSRTAPAPTEWSREPIRAAWLADPLAIDVALQAMIVWSLSHSQTPCLPCGIGRYRQFRRSFPKGGVQITAKVTQATEQMVRADIEFCDQAGQLVARMEDCQNVVFPTLQPAFAQRTLE